MAVKKLCSENPFCSLLAPEIKTALCNISNKIIYQQKQVINLNIGMGQLILIISGELITMRQRVNGRQKGIESLVKGEIFGVSGLFWNQPKTNVETAYIKTSVEACLFSTGSFEKLCLTYPELACEVIRQLSRRFASAVNHVEHICLDTSKEKLLYLTGLLSSQRLRADLPECTLPYTHDELALLTGMNRVTATRAINSLKESGFLSTGRGKLKFPNLSDDLPN